MTDFERKAEKADDGMESHGDPLLELTRLFGVKPRNDHNANGREGKEAQQASAPREEEGRNVALGSAGISMAGNLVVPGGYAVGGFVPPSPSLSVESAERGNVSAYTAYEAVESDFTAQNGEEGSFNEEEAVLWQDTAFDEAFAQTERDGEEREALWSPLSEAGNDVWREADAPLPYVVRDSDETEQIFQALEDEVTAGDLTDIASSHADMSEMVNMPGEALQAELTSASPPLGAPYFKADLESQSPPTPRFSDGYFGYGQSAQVDTQNLHLNPAPQKRAVEPLPASQEVSPTPPVTPLVAPLRKPESLRAPVKPAPVQSQPSFSQKPSSSPAPFPDFSAIDMNEALNEALHDFDLTIQKERRRRRLRSPSPAVEIEKTEAFDLPPVEYNTSPPPLTPDGLSPDSDFDNEFAVMHQGKNTGVAAKAAGSVNQSKAGSGNNNVFSADISARNEQASSLSIPMDGEFGTLDRSAYNWNVASDEKAEGVQSAVRHKGGRRKGKIYAFLTILLLLIGGGGYWLYDFYAASVKDPVLIKAMDGSIKHKPETENGLDLNESSTVVYSQGQEGGNAVQQDTLLNDSENPVNMDLLNPSLVDGNTAASSESSAVAHMNGQDLDPVDASILAATERVVPLHIVPSVAIERDKQGNLTDMVPLGEGEEEVFIPAENYSSQIVENQNRELNNTHVGGEVVSNGDLPENQAVRINQTEGYEVSDLGAGNASSQTESGDTQIHPLFENASEGASINAPALVPDKPTLLPSTRLAANNTPAQRQPAPARNERVDTVLDERFYVQISSQPSQQAAIESVKEMKQRFASLVGKNQTVIVPANINGRTYYRVRVLVSTREEAVSLCENYKLAGGSCFVGR